jgi:hypothetical protein
MRLGTLQGAAYDDGYADGKRSRETEIQEAQARIKKLEEALRFYTPEPLCLVEDIHGNLEDFGTTAHNALSEEAEG